MVYMDIVQRKLFTNDAEIVINEWLETIPAEDIVNVSFHTATFEGTTDEFTVVFYKVAKVRG